MSARYAAILDEQRVADEINTRFVCDLCHGLSGTRFVDGYWSCDQCAREYLDALGLERIRKRLSWKTKGESY